MAASNAAEDTQNGARGTREASSDTSAPTIQFNSIKIEGCVFDYPQKESEYCRSWYCHLCSLLKWLLLALTLCISLWILKGCPKLFGTSAENTCHCMRTK